MAVKLAFTFNDFLCRVDYYDKVTSIKAECYGF